MAKNRKARKNFLLVNKLNWKDITPEEFEKLIFFILDAIGAKNLTWRKGGEGISSSDSGRDLECTFYYPRSKGKIIEEHWWVEVKYRTKTLEKSTVQKSVINSKSAPKCVKKFLILTNTQVSNATIEWVERFDKKYRIPKTIIWQSFDLEKIVLKHSYILLRFFPSSLTISGKSEVIKSQFITQLILPSITELSDFWDNYEKIIFSPFVLIPIIISEINFGDISKRPWLSKCSKEEIINILLTSLCNFHNFIYRCLIYSREQSFIIKGLSYIVESAIFLLDVDLVSKILKDPFKFCSSKLKNSKDLILVLLKPLFGNMFQELFKACVRNCPKIDIIPDDVVFPEYSKYFYRFSSSSFNTDTREKEGFFYIEDLKIKCPIGFENKCPLLRFNINEFSLDNINMYIEIVKKILLYRVRSLE